MAQLADRRSTHPYDLRPTTYDLVMACRAARQFLNLVFLHQSRADLVLIGCDVGHVEDLVARADVLLRRAVAANAPIHRERGGLIRERHLVDAAVARPASDAFGDMNRVVEMNEVWEP